MEWKDQKQQTNGPTHCWFWSFNMKKYRKMLALLIKKCFLYGDSSKWCHNKTNENFLLHQCLKQRDLITTSVFYRLFRHFWNAPLTIHTDVWKQCLSYRVLETDVYTRKDENSWDRTGSLAADGKFSADDPPADLLSAVDLRPRPFCLMTVQATKEDWWC